MSRDFTPRMHFQTYMKFPEIYTSNITWVVGDKSTPFYTEEELEDRKAHIYVHVLGSDIYKNLRNILSDKKFEELNSLLKELVEADFDGKDTKHFPTEMTDWYFNRNGHYYHEPNDEEFLAYIEEKWRNK